jgi:hypothetical protein
MWPLAALVIILAMTRHATSSKLILVENRSAASGPDRVAPVRRYRIARLQLDARARDGASRFDHLKRIYD